MGSVTLVKRKPHFLTTFRKHIEYADHLLLDIKSMALLENITGGHLTILDTTSDHYESFGIGELRSSTKALSMIFARNLKADTLLESSLFAVNTSEGAAIRVGSEIWSVCVFERAASLAFLLVVLYRTNVIKICDAQRIANAHQEAAEIVDLFHLFTASMHASVGSLKLTRHA